MKPPELTVTRISPRHQPDAMATLKVDEHRVFFFKESKIDGNHWYVYTYGATLRAVTLKKLLIVWRLTG